MTNIDIALISNPVNSGDDIKLNKASINQSAWKKELESQLYEKQKNTLASDSNSSSLKFSNDSGLLNDSLLFSELVDMQGKHSVDADGLYHIDSLNNKHPEANSGISTPVKNVPLHKVIDLLPSTALAMSSSAMGKTTTAGNVRKVVDAEVPIVRTQSDLSSKIKPFNIRLLADGELLIRDYKQGLLSDVRLENIVADLKKVMNKDIEKVRINGEVVWQSNKPLAADQYIIDLVE